MTKSLFRDRKVTSDENRMINRIVALPQSLTTKVSKIIYEYNQKNLAQKEPLNLSKVVTKLLIKWVEETGE